MNENEKDIRENEPKADEKKTDNLDDIQEIVIEDILMTLPLCWSIMCGKT